MSYKRLTERVECGGVKYSNGEWWNICYPKNEHCLRDIDRMAIKLCELEDKIENGELVECIYFISWLSEEVCHGQVIGYEEDSGFVVLTNSSMISADKIWTNRKDAEKELLKRKIKELDKEEHQEFKAEAEKKLKELNGKV